MALMTTTIGVYPKPADCPVPNWGDMGGERRSAPTAAYDGYLSRLDRRAKEALDRITQAVVREQDELGIDVPTDGEIRREHYVYYHCRHIEGISFHRLTEKKMRDSSWTARVPTVTAPLRAGPPFLVRDWQIAQTATAKPVKITVPGPLTVTDTIANDHYAAHGDLACAVADCLNVEIRRLADAGCRWIQIDEPVFARQTVEALSYGIECLQRCFHGTGHELRRAVHICCGYPTKLDDQAPNKANAQAYWELAPVLDTAAIDAVSIEDAHRHNDPALLEQFQRTTVILGMVDIAKSRIEPVDLIVDRLRELLDHIEPERLMVAPDCGLALLPASVARAKLINLVEAARRIDQAR